MNSQQHFKMAEDRLFAAQHQLAEIFEEGGTDLASMRGAELTLQAAQVHASLALAAAYTENT